MKKDFYVVKFAYHRLFKPIVLISHWVDAELGYKTSYMKSIQTVSLETTNAALDASRLSHNKR